MLSFNRVIFFGTFSAEINFKKRNFLFSELENHSISSIAVVDYHIMSPRCRVFLSKSLDKVERTSETRAAKFRNVSYLLLKSPSLLFGMLLQMFEILKSANSVKSLSFWKKFFSFSQGLGQMTAKIRKLKINPNDIVVIWGENLPGHRIMAFFAHQNKARCFIAEYGEFQQTMFISEAGMLHNAWPNTKSNFFYHLPINEDDRSKAKQFLSSLHTNKISNKVYDKTLTIKDRIRSYNRPVVYVSGIEMYASSLIPRLLKSSHSFSPRFKTNRHLLTCVLNAAKINNWTVLYKDHPNTLVHNPNAIISGLQDDHLIILENVDIYDVMEVADVTVTLGSKVSIVSLMCNVPVVMVGPYTLTQQQISQGLIESTDVEEAIKKTLANRTVNQNDLVDFTTRMLKYYLYELQETDLYFNRNRFTIWSDVESYLAGERSVISTSERVLQAGKLSNVADAH